MADLLSYADALGILQNLSAPQNSEYQGIQGLTDLVADTSATNAYAAPNAIGLYFSGNIGNLSSSTITSLITFASNDVSINSFPDPGQMVNYIGDTDAGYLLTSDQFAVALQSAAVAAGLTAKNPRGQPLARESTPDMTPNAPDACSRTRSPGARRYSAYAWHACDSAFNAMLTRLISKSFCRAVAAALVFSSMTHAAYGDDLQKDNPATVAADMSAQFERFSMGVLQADRGVPDGYRLIQEGSDKFALDLNLLHGLLDNCSAAPDTVATSLNTIATAWTPFYNITSRLQGQETAFGDIRNAVREINDTESKLLDLSLHIAALRGKNGGSADELSAANLLPFVLMRLSKNANRMLSDDVVSPEIAFMVNQDPKSFVKLTDGLLNGSKTPHLRPADGVEKEKLRELSKLFETDSHAAALISSNSNLKLMITIKQYNRYVLQHGDEFLSALLALRAEIPSDAACAR